MSQNGCNIYEVEILQETQGPAALSGATPFSILCICAAIYISFCVNCLTYFSVTSQGNFLLYSD